MVDYQLVQDKEGFEIMNLISSPSHRKKFRNGQNENCFQKESRVLWSANRNFHNDEYGDNYRKNNGNLVIVKMVIGIDNYF